MQTGQIEMAAALTGKITMVKERFLSRLPHRVHEISLEVARITPAGDGVENLERLFHTIAGSASTFGLVAVASLAREAEEICSAHSLDHESLAYLRIVSSDLEELATSSAQSHAA